MSNVHCIFRDLQGNSEKYCGVALSPRDEETCMTNSLYKSESRLLTANSMISVNLPKVSPSPTNMFCYVITASNGSFTAKIEGTFNAGVLCCLCIHMYL